MAKQYTVKPGDTLSGISQRELGDPNRYKEIQGYGGDPTKLQVGTVLTIPGSPTVINPTRTPQATGNTSIQTIPQTFGGVQYDVQVPQGPDQAQELLNNFQNRVFSQINKSGGLFKTDDQIKAEMNSMIQTTQSRPTAPNLVDLFYKLRDDEGITDIEGKITGIQDQKQAIIDEFLGQKKQLKGTAMVQSVLDGQMGNLSDDAKEALDLLDMQEKRLYDRFNMKNTLVNTIINLTDTDFQNALKSYESEFNEKLTFYKTYATESKDERSFLADTALKTNDQVFNQNVKKEQLRMDREELSFNKQVAIQKLRDDQKVQDQQIATANLEIFAKYLSDGNISVEQMTPEMKMQIQKLEVQSGLGIGFLSMVKNLQPNAKIKNTLQRTDENGIKFADVIMQDANGKVFVETVELGKDFTKAAEKETTLSEDQLNYGVDLLYQVDENGDKLLSVDEAQSALEKMIAYTGNEALGAELFDRAWQLEGFKSYKW